jgi:anti-sigma factor RsiW
MSSDASCTETMRTDHHFERLLNLYVDGELTGGEQAKLFAHLSTCAACRAQFNVLLAFRLASRQETFVVPPAVDEAVFARIDRLRRAPGFTSDRVSERRFFGGQIHRRVSFRSALLAAVVLIAFGLAVRPTPTPDAAASTYHVTETVIDDGALYVIGPGVTVEGKRLGR